MQGLLVVQRLTEIVAELNTAIGLRYGKQAPILLRNDNQAAVTVMTSENTLYEPFSRHIEMRLGRIHDLNYENPIEVEYCPTVIR
jgi:hypothetical protein